ncbi:MAG: hypothetical protein JWM77_737 [Rhodospirillales bacterium]|jgi:hypothetical protein|nr:hypothetical protein [Rhodospirillales bacterium]
MRQPTDIVPIILPGLFNRPEAEPPCQPQQRRDAIPHRAPRPGWRALETVFAATRVRSHWG